MLSIIYNSVSILNTVLSNSTYIFSCDANNFQISRSQRRVIQNMNLFINENIKPDATTTTTNPIPLNNNKKPLELNEWLKTESSTRAIQLIRHILTKDTRMNRLSIFYSFVHY